MSVVTVGFARMMKEPGEKRVFLPEFIQFLVHRGATVVIEEGYGSRSGIGFADYRQGNEAVRSGTRGEAFLQDLVMVLRSPGLEEFRALGPGSCLVSMLHFPTRPTRVETLRALGAGAISLDSIEDDHDVRLVENMRSVSWNGLEAAFDALEALRHGIRRSDGGPIRILVLGTGMVGRHALDAATKLGSVERNERHMREGGPGVIPLCAGRNLTADAGTMESLFRRTDILVDATQRRDPSRPVVPNAWIAWLPEDAVITDLAVDPYALDVTPPVVRGIEGIPQGNLDQFVFRPGDPAWDRTVPAGVPADNRRTVVSCYSWPGVHPEACMRHYARQLEPLMETLLERGYANLSRDGGYFERALYRGTLRAWLTSGRYRPHRR